MVREKSSYHRATVFLCVSFLEILPKVTEMEWFFLLAKKHDQCREEAKPSNFNHVLQKKRTEDRM